ncbi:MAG TPA: fructose-specific PTS transporter subunit EIIC [Corynebacterium kroppenstedtii]|nr:fructose-specific PTS transporter subunit EIIC [Corynebacterium kroppenstedtii]
MSTDGNSDPSLGGTAAVDGTNTVNETKAIDRENPTVAGSTILAITACPTGIAHTYMAAEKLEAAAKESGATIKVETHGSIGVDNAFSHADIAGADAVVIAADIAIDKERFVNKRLVITGVDAAISNPDDLLRRALVAPRWGQPHRNGKPGHNGDHGAGNGGREAFGSSLSPNTDGASMNGSTNDGSSLNPATVIYRTLMAGVSRMIPFVVTGGLLIAVALSLGGHPTSEGMQIPKDSFWYDINQLGTLAFSLMVPVLSAYIAEGIADRSALAPGFITGMVAVTGSLYGSEAGTGFIGGIVTGILSGYVALAIRKIPVNKYVAPIWPIIVIPIVTTLIVGLLVIYVVGAPIASLFDALTHWLASMNGTSSVVLGAVLGAMIAFDMGGPFNKTAFLFGGGLIAAGNAAPMGMNAAAIAVPPLAMGVITFIRRQWFTKPEKDAGIAALIMGCFGITEGAIPFAAARPFQVIPANVIGGAVAGALAGLWGVKDNVMHGGPIVAVLGAIDGVAWFFLAVLAGIATTVAVMMGLTRISMSRSKNSPKSTSNASDAGAAPDPSNDASNPRDTGAVSTSEPAGAVSGTKRAEEPDAPHIIDETLVVLDDNAPSGNREDVIRGLVDHAVSAGRITDGEAVIQAALAREEQSTTAVGNEVAIPHARVAGVTTPTVLFARIPGDGVDWNSPDNTTVRFVFLIAVPEGANKKHMKILAQLARALMRDNFCTRLREAATRTEIVDAVREAVGNL